jgi:hypothetical protein
MAGFARVPDVTAKLCDIIEYLQSDAVQEQAELDATFLLKELNRLLADSKIRVDHLGKLERLIREVRAGRAEILSGDRALALKRFKEALEYWMKPATEGE